MNEELEQQRAQARQLCAARGVAIVPYGRAWWLTGNGVSRVVADLAGLTAADLEPLPITER